MIEHNHLLFSSVVLQSLFCNTSMNELVQKSKTANICEYSDEELLNVLKDQLHNYNFYELKSYIHVFMQRYNSNTNPVNIFSIIFDFSNEIITYCDENYRFKYEYTDIWRGFTKNMDEETAVISAIFQDDIRKRNFNRTFWDWPFCIEHDNHELISILKRDNGVSENHFHLRGSSAYFYISWVLLMNNVSDPNYENNFLKIEENRLKATKDSIRQTPLSLICLKASAIRLFLYSAVVNNSALIEEYSIEKSTIDRDKYIYNFEYNNNEFGELERIPLKKAKKYYCSNKSSFKAYKDYCLENMYFWLINEVLPCNNTKLFPIKQIQDTIDKWSILGTVGGNIDYAQWSAAIRNKKYFALSGERSIIYNSIKCIYKKHGNYKKIETLLYLYLHAKHQFRVELVQSNAYIGFHNFQDYQNRKDYFIPWSDEFEEKIIADTICSIMETPKIHKVELRITPRNTVKENVKNIQTSEKAIDRAFEYIETDKVGQRDNSDNHGMKDDFKNKFFYTLHFIKIPDSQFEVGCCRDGFLRKRTEEQANAILDIRSSHLSVAKRILGIDAAGEEINCRPETFGTVFRHLQYYDGNSANISHSNELSQLKATYHVGEDNYDIVDALRAINEAILFLGLRSGSRLGHATLLGMPAEEFYKKKNNSIHMPQQVFLDNIVWMYFFIKNNAVFFDDMVLLMSYLEEQFQIYFNKIYLNGIQYDRVNYKIKKVARFKHYDNIPKNRDLCNFDIYHYYLSWLLRGDDPELYINGSFDSPHIESEMYKICCFDERMSTARKSFEAVYLYYLYHYDIEARKTGTHEITVPLSEYFIKAVDAIQKDLIKKIEKWGIAIETNPSSNLLISSINSYDEHPISNFYDNRLKKSSRETQLNVSINTDDKSVFSTCLSNEYAYLAFYLENKRNDKGECLYKRFEIYNWLDEIRRMGNEQSFDYGNIGRY